MLNPSTADGSVDDPTIRRCVGFSRSWGMGGLVVVNLFAFRATKPAALWLSEDPVGPYTLEQMKAAAGRCEVVVAAWGAHRRPPKFGVPREHTVDGRAAVVVNALEVELGAELYVLARTRSGAPAHPLYQRGDTVLARWVGARRYPMPPKAELFCRCGHPWTDHAPTLRGAREARELGTIAVQDLRTCEAAVRPKAHRAADDDRGDLRCTCQVFRAPGPGDFIDPAERSQMGRRAVDRALRRPDLRLVP